MCRRLILILFLGCLVSAVACGETGDDAGGTRPSVVVTTSILGDVVANLVGDDVDVKVIMPRGADPHEFAPSPKQAISLREADLVVANGAGFEAGLGDSLDAAVADGVTVVNATDFIPVLDDDSADPDPHFFTDPARMAKVAREIAGVLRDKVQALDRPIARTRASDYINELEEIDAMIERTLSAVPADRRKLVTNHDVFGYFAERYDFEVIGAVIPGGSTLGESSAGQITELAETVVREKVPAVFADTSSPDKLAAAVADEAGGEVKVVELYSESLGGDGSDGSTYIEMVVTNARRISEALA